MARASPKLFVTPYYLDELKKKLRIGQTVITYKAPWHNLTGRYARDAEEKKRIGKVVAKYRHYFVVEFKNGIKECFQYTDLLTGDVMVEGDDSFAIQKEGIYLLTL